MTDEIYSPCICAPYLVPVPLNALFAETTSLPASNPVYSSTTRPRPNRSIFDQFDALRVTLHVEQECSHDPVR
jgi:hypothetical protein